MKNTFLKVLSFVMALTMLVGTFGTSVFAADAHTHVYEEKTVAATCKTAAYTYMACACGDTKDYIYKGEPLDECAEADLEDLPASDATCTDPAYEAGKKCKVCGTEYPGAPITSKPALNHDWDLVIVQPDCGVEGKISKVCQREGCGFEQVLQKINGDASANCAGVTADVTAHTYAYVILRAPSCGVTGLAKYYCTKCGDVVTDVIPAVALTHNYGSWVIDAAATCDQDGSKHRTCSICGDVDTVAIKMDHDWKSITEYCDCVAKRNGDDDYSNDVLKYSQEATCYQSGYVWQHCANCDAIRQNTTSETAHDWDHTDATKFVNLGTAQKPNKVFYYGTYVEHSDCAQVTHYYNKCKDCGYVEIIEELETKADHAWKKSGSTIDYKADVTPAADKVCVTTVNYYKVCTKCGFELLDHSVEAQGHVWEDRLNQKGELQWTYVPYTGTLAPCAPGAASYYIRECTKCDAEEKVCEFTQAHKKNVYTCDDASCTDFACVDCTHAGRKLACSVCEATFGDVCTQEEHTLQTQDKATLKSAADCNSKAVYTYACVNPNCGYKEDNEYGDVNPEVHDKDMYQIVTESPATCEAKGKLYYICFHCNPGKTIEKEIPALGHKEVAIGTAKAATCMEEGITAGKKCERCDEVFEAQKPIPVDASKHVGTATVVYSTAATCMWATVELKAYSTCGHVALVTEGTAVNKVNHVSLVPKDTNNDGKWDIIDTPSAVETVAAVGATCTTDGMHGYTRCTLCDVLVTVAAAQETGDVKCNDTVKCTTAVHTNLEKLEQSYTGTVANPKNIKQNKFEAVKAQLVIKAYGHEFSTSKGAATLIPYKSETCVLDGNKAKIECARCEAIDPNNDGSTIKAHGATGSHITVIPTDKAPTCTATGETKGTWCTKCAAQLKAGDTPCTACYSINNNTYVIPANGHSVKVTIVAQSCTAEGYDMWKCENCTALTATAGQKVTKYDRTGANPTTKTLTATENIWYFENYKAAAHTWADTATTVPASCTEAEKSVYFCTVCTTEYDATRVTYSETNLATGHTVAGVADPVETLTCEQTCTVCSATGHVIVNAAPTCEDKGYDFCLNCDFKTNEVNANGHKFNATISYVEQTSLADGLWTWSCKNCDEVQETVLVYSHEIDFGIEINPYVEGKDAADLEFVKGGYIEVIVNVTLEDTTFSGLEYALNYNPKYLEFVSAECVYDFGEAAFEIIKTDNGNNVKITGHFNGGTGVLGGEGAGLFRYIFKVSPATNYINEAILGHGAVAFDEDTVITITKSTVFSTLVGNKIDFALMGDIDGNGNYSVDDLIAIKAMFTGDYNNLADVDSDGDVDVDDYRAIGKFTNSNKTLADYYAMFGYDIVEILANATIPNMNGDTVINEVDRQLFEAEIYGPTYAWLITTTGSNHFGFYDEYLKMLLYI